MLPSARLVAPTTGHRLYDHACSKNSSICLIEREDWDGSLLHTTFAQIDRHVFSDVPQFADNAITL
jgi:hypothetical protein